MIVSLFLANFILSGFFRVLGAGHILQDEYCFLATSFSVEHECSPL